MKKLRLASSGVIGAMAIVLSPNAGFGQVVSVSQLVCNPNNLTSGMSTTCTVTLSGAAPAGGKEVLLSSNNAIMSLPGASVTVPAGATSSTFKATVGSISSNQTARLTATGQNSVLLNWTASGSPNVTNYNVYRGVSSGGPYSIATTLGVATTYTDYNLQNGQTYYYVTTAVDNTGGESTYSNQASASVPSGVSQTATVNLLAPGILSSLVCNPSSLSSGAATICTVTLSSAAPSGGIVISLSSNNPLLPVPAGFVTVPAGATSTTFTATAVTIPTNQSVILTATLNGVSQTATVGLVATASQAVYVVDTGNNRVEMFDTSGNYIGQFGSSGSGNGQFNGLGAIAIDASGNVWVTDYWNSRVEEFSSTGTYLSQFGSSGNPFYRPNGIAIDANGNIWVSDEYASQVYEFNFSGTVLGSFGSPGSGNGQFGGNVGALAFDKSGNLWVADEGNHRAEIFTPGGSYVNQIAASASGCNPNFTPLGFVFDASGDVFVSEGNCVTVEKFNSSYIYVGSIGGWGYGNGTYRIGGGLAVDSNGNFYVTSYNGNVEVYNSTGTYQFQFGTPGSGSGQLDTPAGIAIGK